MKNFKKALLIIGILITIPLIAAMFLKNNYAVERKIVINKPKSEVFEYLKFLKNQDNFSKWATMDPDMKKSYRGKDGTVGFVSAWESTNEDVGQGEQEIEKITEGERIDYELRFIEPFESTEKAYMTTTTVAENQTAVTWGFTGHMAYPSNIWLLFLNFEEMIGGDLQTGLEKLKSELEK